MEWLRAHRGVWVGSAITLLLVCGAALLLSRSGTSAQRGAGGWGGGAEFIPNAGAFSTKQPPPRHIPVSEEELFRNLANNPERNYKVLEPSTRSYASIGTTTSSGAYTYDSADITALVEAVGSSARFNQPRVEGEDEKEVTLNDVYGYLPAGLVQQAATSAPRTREQADLFAYGNRAGSAIESYMETWGSRQAYILRKVLEDRTDQFKTAEANELADAMTQLARDLADVEAVPDLVKKEHETLARGYWEIAKRTKAVINAQDEDALLEAVNASNQTADAFAKAYLAIVDIFSIHSVKFSSSDAGRVFSFTAL